MILRFRHKALKRFYESGDSRGLNPQHVEKIRRILQRLGRAKNPGYMDIPGFRLHPLKGGFAEHWSVSVNANWRIVFRFENGNATDANLVDYH